METVSYFPFIQDRNTFILFNILSIFFTVRKGKTDSFSHHSHSHLEIQERAAAEKNFAGTEKTSPSSRRGVGVSCVLGFVQ